MSTQPPKDFFTNRERVKTTGTADGSVHIPGQGSAPMVGVDPAEFNRKREEQAVRMATLRRQMAATWKCSQCRKQWRGTHIRVVIRNVAGTPTEVLVCPDLKCDAAVVMVSDPLSLTNPPKETL